MKLVYISGKEFRQMKEEIEHIHHQLPYYYMKMKIIMFILMKMIQKYLQQEDQEKADNTEIRQRQL